MKHRLLAWALILALSLPLCGCSSLMKRDYASVSPHSVTPVADGDPSVLRAERYQDLVNAIIYLVSQGRETGRIHLYLEQARAKSDLKAACLEVKQEDPLGAYAVEDIAYTMTNSEEYCEIDLQIQYRRTRDQINGIVITTGTTAIREALENTMSKHQTECALRINPFEKRGYDFEQLMREAYYNAPSCALGMPEVSVSLYPDSGRQRIAEIVFQYPLTQEEWNRRQTLLEEEIVRMASELDHGSQNEQIMESAQMIRAAGGHRSGGGNTAYHALLGGGGDSEALALAMTLLCQKLGISCQLVQGSRSGSACFWNVVQTEGGYQHIDLSRTDGTALTFRGDEEMMGLNYVWDTQTTPACQSLTEQTGQEGN